MAWLEEWQDRQIAGTRCQANARAAKGKLIAAPKVTTWGILKMHWIDAIRSQVLSGAFTISIWMQSTD